MTINLGGGGSIIDCSNCESATRVTKGGCTYYECSEIRQMNIPNKFDFHPAHEVMAIGDKVYVPKCCPNPEVLPEQMVGDY
jgi:hypothetical protein